MKAEQTGPLSIVTVAFLAILASASGGRLTSMSMVSNGVPRSSSSPLPPSETKSQMSSNSTFCYQPVDDLLQEFNPGYVSGSSFSVRSLIATLPDPIDSHVDWDFDLYLAAIQDAITASGYVLDRYSLPWECAREAQQRVWSKDDKPEARALAHLHRENPGVILFRNEESDKDTVPLLVLFLIGETPTSGIHRTAFEKAISWAKDHQSPQEKNIRILGPSFSGSIPSLQIALKQVVSKSSRTSSTLKFTIISGAATNIHNKASLECTLPEQVTYQATVFPDIALKETVGNYFRNLGIDKSKIAVLTESNTSYGRNLIEEVGGQEPESRPKDPPPDRTAKCIKEKEATLPRRDEDWWILPFPLHISRVRTAYEKEKAARSGHNEASEALPRLALELPLDDPGNPRDVLPSLVPSMTTTADELVLANILSTISREGIQYVGLLATSLKDKLFLAQQIYKYCPGVRLFTFGSDLLLTHPDEEQYLEGMLVATPYPLLNKNQLWSFPFSGTNRRLQFAMEDTEGIYNAVLILLGHMENLVEYTPPAFSLKPSPSILVPTKPPIWLSVVGRNGLWPLRFSMEYNDKIHYVFTNFYFTNRLQPPTEWGVRPLEFLWKKPLPESRSFRFSMIFFCLITLFCLVQSAGYFTVAYWPSNKRLQSRYQLFSVFRPLGRQKKRREQQVYIVVCFLSLVVSYTFLAAIFFIPPIEGNYWLGWWLVGVLVVICQLSLIVVIIDVLLHPQQFISPQDRGWALLLLLTGIAFIILYYVLFRDLGLPWLVAKFLYLSPEEIPLFYERTVSLASGLSPALPVVVLCAGWYLWGFCQLRRLCLLDGLVTLSPFARYERRVSKCHASAIPIVGISDLEICIRNTLRRPVLNSPLPLIGFILVAGYLLPFVVVHSRIVPAFEGPIFTFFFEGALFGLYAGLILAFLQFLTLWNYFRLWLCRFAFHPMVESFGRLPSHTMQTLGKFYTGVATLRDLEPAVQFWSLLSQYGRLDFPLEARVQSPSFTRKPLNIIAVFRNDLRANVCRDVGGAAAHSQTWRKLSRLAQDLISALDIFWRQEAVYLSPPAETSKEKKEETENPVPVETGRYILPSGDSFRFRPRVAEDFLAQLHVIFISQIFSHLRNLLTFFTLASLLLLFAVMVYPFEPRRLLLVVIWSVIISVTAGAMVVLVQMERSEVLSRIAGTNPNKVTLNGTFVVSILAYGVVPLMTLLVTQFPTMRGLVSWVEPVVRILNGG